MSKTRILVIDDEPIIRLSCKKALEPECLVDVAASGVEGLQMFDSAAYDLVLLDLKMPGMDGMEVITELKRRNPSQVIMVMTGYDTIELMVDSISLGAAHYLEKPFTPVTLMERISEVLER